MAKAHKVDLHNIVENWTKRTDKVLRMERRKLRVNDKYLLDKSAQWKVYQLAKAELTSEIEFLVRGRFRDMGAGRGRKKIESVYGNAENLGIKKRKPKRWYSRAYWGRINDLQGVVGFKIMEASIRAVKDPLSDINKGTY